MTLADINVSVRVDPNTVRRIAELSGSISLFTPPSDDLSIKGHNANALSALGDMNDIIAINKEIIWGTEVRPLG